MSNSPYVNDSYYFEDTICSGCDGQMILSDDEEGLYCPECHPPSEPPCNCTNCIYDY